MGLFLFSKRFTSSEVTQNISPTPVSFDRMESFFLGGGEGGGREQDKTPKLSVIIFSFLSFLFLNPI